jgi:hypothetical protein
MAHDLVLGETRRSFALGSIEPGATGYAPTRWISRSESEAMVAALTNRSGFLTPPLSRVAAETRVREHLRAKKIGIASEISGLDLGRLLVDKLRGRPRPTSKKK